MTIDVRCLVCRSKTRARGVELMHNGEMSPSEIAQVVNVEGIGPTTITRHVRDHAEGDARQHALVVEPERSAAERVANLQRLQLDEVERRIQIAKERADLMNSEREKMNLAGGDAEGNMWPMVDWSDFFDVLGKDGQSAIGSILKAQGLKDKRDMKRDDLKLGLFEAMQRGGLAPKALSGIEIPAIPAEATDDAAD